MITVKVDLNKGRYVSLEEEETSFSFYPLGEATFRGTKASFLTWGGMEVRFEVLDDGKVLVIQYDRFNVVLRFTTRRQLEGGTESLKKLVQDWNHD